MSINTLVKTVSAGVKAHKPEIMIGIGLAAGAGAIFMAIKETPACIEAFDKAESEIPSTTVTNENGEEVEIKLDLSWRDKTLIILKHYWPAMTLEAASIFFIIFGTKIRLDGYTALAAVYGITKAERDDLKNFISEQPKNWQKNFREKFAEYHVDNSDVNDIPEPKMSDAEVPMPLPLFWDDQAKIYFRMSEEDLRDAIADFTNLIDTDPFQATTMNDWMRIIDHEDVVAGDHYLMTKNSPTWDGAALKYQQIGVKEAPTKEPARMMTFTKDYILDTRGIYSNV